MLTNNINVVISIAFTAHVVASVDLTRKLMPLKCSFACTETRPPHVNPI